MALFAGVAGTIAMAFLAFGIVKKAGSRYS